MKLRRWSQGRLGMSQASVDVRRFDHIGSVQLDIESNRQKWAIAEKWCSAPDGQSDCHY